MASLGEAIKQNSSLQSLNMSFNKIGKAGAVSLGEAIKQHTSLQSLNMSSNRIGNVGCGKPG